MPNLMDLIADIQRQIGDLQRFGSSGGEGVPDGGATGQVLTKASNDDQDVEWSNPPGGGDMLASVYDPNEIEADVFNADNHVSGTTNKVYTATEQTKLSNIEQNADVTDAGNVGSSIHGSSAKTTPVDADTLVLIDSEASNVLKKVSWSNIKATLKTYFDGIYSTFSGSYNDLSDKPSIPSTFDDLSDGTTNKAFTSSEKSKLSGIEAGADATDATNVEAAGALMDSEVDADIKTLSLPANTTITDFTKTVLGCNSASDVRDTLLVPEADGFVKITVSDSEPDDPQEGDIWIDIS
jgi:hypothetical protein